MANCSYCDSFILLGGKTDQTGRYCNGSCQQAGNLLALSAQLRPAEIQRLVQEVHHGNCPRCGNPGPVDVYKAHKVWSAFVLTSWSSSPAVSCKSCATKRQLGAIAFSGVLGWWGFPWGFIITPTQVIRNIVEMCSSPTQGQPSPLLERVVRLQAGAAIAQHFVSGKTPPPVPVPPRIQPEPVGAAPALTDDSRYMPKA
jgi:hypothetical protein